MKYLLKYLIIGLVAVILTGCENPLPMSAAEAEILKLCEKQRLVPYFYANGSSRQVYCKEK